jgi:molybdenum cofactor cytidylyltransferase
MPIFALLPAAGISSRMGRPKLALPLGGRMVLERVLDALRAASIDKILVVLGPQVHALQSQAADAGALTLLLEQQTPDMRATIECGLDCLEQKYRPKAEDAFLLLPPDHPTLAQAPIEALLKARAESSATIWIPTFEGRRGHPALINWSHVPGIRALPPGNGLNTYLRTRAHETMEIPCPSPEILCDLDTPADYERLQQFFSDS